MASGDDYSSLQQPSGGYAAAGDGMASYTGSQSPPSPYTAGGPVASTITAGLGNGVNLQPSYYYDGDVDLGWNLMAKYPKIKSVRIEIEMGREAVAERWIREAVSRKYAVLKNERVFHEDYATREEAARDMFDYIERFYNRRRRHSALGYHSPAQHHAGWIAGQKLAG